MSYWAKFKEKYFRWKVHKNDTFLGLGTNNNNVYYLVLRKLTYIKWSNAHYKRSMRIPVKQQPGGVKFLFGNVPVISKTAHPSFHPWLKFCSVQWRIWPNWGSPSRAFDFRVGGRKRILLLFPHSAWLCTAFTTGSLLLYSLFCWSICEPLKKPVKCGLSGMNNFTEINKP